MANKNTIIRHHLLEIILWPNGDGTFRTILNSAERLKELGIYDDYKMTIPMTQSEHCSLHNANMSDETRHKLSVASKGERNPMYGRTGELRGMYGKKHSAETRRKMSEARRGKPRGPYKKHSV